MWVADIKTISMMIEPVYLLVILFAGLLSLLFGPVWCRYLCPVGGIYSAVGELSPCKVVRNDDTCIHCSRCDKVCHAFVRDRGVARRQRHRVRRLHGLREGVPGRRTASRPRRFGRVVIAPWVWPLLVGGPVVRHLRLRLRHRQLEVADPAEQFKAAVQSGVLEQSEHAPVVTPMHGRYLRRVLPCAQSCVHRRRLRGELPARRGSSMLDATLVRDGIDTRLAEFRSAALGDEGRGPLLLPAADRRAGQPPRDHGRRPRDGHARLVQLPRAHRPSPHRRCRRERAIERVRHRRRRRASAHRDERPARSASRRGSRAFASRDDACVYSSGYVTNVAIITGLTGPGDLVLMDKLDHASIVDGALLSGAKWRTYRHNDMAHLEKLLAEAQGEYGTILVVADSVFSMDGDIMDLPTTKALCERYGARLMVDEAHSIGSLGATGHGIEEHFDMVGSIDLKMGTLSKSIPSIGGYLAADGDVVDYLRHFSRPFIFSAALPPAPTAAALEAFDVIEDEPWRVAELHRIQDALHRRA